MYLPKGNSTDTHAHKIDIHFMNFHTSLVVHQCYSNYDGQCLRREGAWISKAVMSQQQTAHNKFFRGLNSSVKVTPGVPQ